MRRSRRPNARTPTPRCPKTADPREQRELYHYEKTAIDSTVKSAGEPAEIYAISDHDLRWTCGRLFLSRRGEGGGDRENIRRFFVIDKSQAEAIMMEVS